MTLLSRRALMAGAVFLSGMAASPAFAQFGRSVAFPQFFSSFAVDVTPLKAKGLGPFADLVAAATLSQLRHSFADRVDRRGPRLVVRLDEVYLTAFPGSGGGDRFRHGGGGGGSDSINGVAFAVGPRGEILAQFPQHAVLEADRGIVDPDEQGRAVAIAQHYVLWLRRQLIS